MTSDILTLHNVPQAPAQAQAPAQEWTLLEQGVYWQGEADACATAATIDIVGVADSKLFEACFLLMP